jgi:phosphate transport system substrate-binding protein
MVVGLGAAALAGCAEGGGEAGGGRVVVTGSSTVAPLVAEMARRFEAGRPGVRVDVETGGSGRGIADVRVGRAELGMVSRRLKRDESDLAGHVLALDGVGVIVHGANDVAGLSREQLAAIFTGEAGDWAEVGGSGGRIVVVNKADGRATLEVFLGYLGLDSADVKADVVVGENLHAIQTVAGNRGAIGYVSVGVAAGPDGAGVRLVGVDGVEATVVAVARGEFPVVRPLQLVTKGGVEGLAAEFLAYVRSGEVSDLVEQYGYVPALD